MISHDVDILARTIYGEARGEYVSLSGGLAAYIAVANVVVNRSLEPLRYGGSIAAVCQKPYQFSCWNQNDPNLDVIEAVERGEDVLFDLAIEVAKHVVKREWPDLTNGSNHYFSNTMNAEPAWAVNQRCLRQIGRHRFYKL